MKIRSILAQEILDSRGNPTIRTSIQLESGLRGSASVPSGASTGSHEAAELRDGGKRYGGKGVLKAIRNVNTIIQKALKNKDIFDLQALDRVMMECDGTKNKAKLGANAILSVSLAAARVGALASDVPLYRYIRELYGLHYKKFTLPFAGMNIINGGMHARNNLSIQEFMIIPQQKLFRERVRVGAEIFHQLTQLLIQKSYFTGVGDEGGYSPNIPNGSKDNEQALQLIMKAIKKAGYIPGKDVFLGLDAAASEFFKKGRYYFVDSSHPWHAEDLIKLWQDWAKKYPLMLIEDGLAEDEWSNWKILTEKLGKQVALVGDDLFVTNKERLQRGIQEAVANTVLIKPNQIGTVTETMETIRLAQEHNYKIMVSHRSGDTADTFIADLAVAVNADFIKTGSLSRSERVEKYNRLMEIEYEITSI
jgi:enolase